MSMFNTAYASRFRVLQAGQDLLPAGVNELFDEQITQVVGGDGTAAATKVESTCKIVAGVTFCKVVTTSIQAGSTGAGGASSSIAQSIPPATPTTGPTKTE